jgi:hypothetical protein
VVRKVLVVVAVWEMVTRESVAASMSTPPNGTLKGCPPGEHPVGRA